jgi:phosphate transport system substrate-binding protein
VPDDFALNLPDPEPKDAYPIVSLTWLLMYEKPKDPAKTKAAADFLRWALKDGKPAAVELGYIPLPEEMVTKVTAALDTVGK